jgi:putative endonuclease
MSSPQELGRNGEDQAVADLQARGYEILARNWRCEIGEADIIAAHEGDLVIVEVKTRRGKNASSRALESLTPQKQAKLLALAQAYQSLLGDDASAYDGLRVDVVTIAVTNRGTFVEVYPNAVGW